MTQDITHSLSLFLADNYLLQIQEYSTATPATTTPSKPDEAPKTVPTSPEQAPKWFDVDVVKGTQYTVTAYQVPVEDPTKVHAQKFFSPIKNFTGQ